MCSKEREHWIDIAKGLGILMVILAHSRLELNYVSRVCVGCHMPLFFALGGILTNNTDGIVLKRIKTIIVPYIGFSALYLYGYIVSKNTSGSINTIIDTVTLKGVGTLWFLPTYFFVVVIISYIQKLDRYKYFCFIVQFLITLGLTYLLGTVQNNYGFYFVRVAWGLTFASLGLVIKDYSNNIKYGWIACILYLCMCVNGNFFNYDLRRGVVENPFTYCALGLLGTISIIFISKCMEKNKVFEFVGRHSLFYMGIHLPIIIFLEDALEKRIESPILFQGTMFGIALFASTSMLLIYMLVGRKRL